MNKRRIGSRYEEMAAAFLEKQGLFIVARNFRCKSGEIDLIARDGKYLVFVEVKYRRGKGQGNASAAVDWHKQKRISQTAGFFLLRYGYGEPPCRFDVVAIDGKEVQWIKNAFDYCR
ncbi:YraN family protein [Blautia sp. MSJ-19]|uniref:YraN family protein n=1 Tax=Blautia sp. MSJ-19 TaxID=2841517 RepID=UPI001C0EDC53|nr:YraN family protein [Blautia sp. MSJ-19]